MSHSASYYFKENGWTIWLTAQQYRSLRAGFEQRASAGNLEAIRRLKGFGPAPEAEIHETGVEK
tara:strand:- start:238 stop:429 length:192 start_codon:yes stop_codon:yes gene_type:complete